MTRGRWDVVPGERSRSLVAPIVAHGVGNAAEVGAVMLLMLAWG